MTRCAPGCECNTPAEYLPPCSCGCGAGEREPRIVKDPPAWTPLLFTCTRCPLSFPFMADLREHLKRDHLKWYE